MNHQTKVLSNTHQQADQRRAWLGYTKVKEPDQHVSGCGRL